MATRKKATKKKNTIAAKAAVAPAPGQEFGFGYGKRIFPEDEPIVGANIERLKDEAVYDLNTIEASLGISRRDYYYELRDNLGDRQLPDIAMAILVRLYEAYPKETLPFQPMRWADYLTSIGVHPGEFAQLVGRAFLAGRSWQEGGKPIRSVQLIIEALWRAGVNSTSHPIYQEFLRIAEKEFQMRTRIWLSPSAEEDKWIQSKVFSRFGPEKGAAILYKYNEQGTIVGVLESKIKENPEWSKRKALEWILAKVLGSEDKLGIQKAPTKTRQRRQTKTLALAEDSMLQPVED
jgi:hypothetical protein